MNENDFYLSLGNFIRSVKEMAQNKSSALQTEIFCILFSLDFVSPTTVNNYCVGIRSIGDTYKQHYVYLSSRYKKDKNVFLSILLGILSVLNGKVYKEENISFLNEQESIKKLAIKMYNISKNDASISKEVLKNWNLFIEEKNYYAFLVEVLFHVVLENKQPLYEVDIRKKKMEELLLDSYMGYKGIEDYLQLKIKESVNYDYTLKELASKGNVLANYELGSNEYLGYVKGYPRYSLAYKYLRVAYEAGHAGASYLLGKMLYSGLLGSQTNADYEEAYAYFLQGKKLGSMASVNKLGLMYLHGIFPVSKDIEKAKVLFLEAAEKNYVYALNNLGMIHEKSHDDTYLEYYKKSASLKESWACNKMGEYYRKQGDMVLAYGYYMDAIDADFKHLCYYAYYNLAKYFYKHGSKENGIEKDKNTYVEYLELASEHDVLEASIELFEYFMEKYLKTKDSFLWENALKYKMKIETHLKYNLEIKNNIEAWLKRVSQKKEIEIIFEKKH